MTQYNLSDGDVSLVQQTIDATLGPTGTARLDRRTASPAKWSPKLGQARLLGLAKITAAGADADHWKWSFSLRHAADGTFTSPNTDSDKCGECVIANSWPACIGTPGLLFYQWGDDNKLYLLLIPILPGGITGLVTGNATGKGKYVGKSFAGVTADVSDSTDLAEADFGTLSSTVDCLILNPPELGSSTTGHDVTAAANSSQFSTYFTGRLAYVNADGTKIVHAQIFWAGC